MARWVRRGATTSIVAVVVTMAAAVGIVGCTSPAAQTDGLKPNEWVVGEPSPVGGTTLSSTDLTTLQSTNRRSATLFAPTDRAEGERLPVVIVLHGLGYSGYDTMSVGNWLPQLDARRAIGVFPAGINQSWNAGSCCKPANVSMIDDVAFLASLTTLLQHRDDVDPSRIYMAGFSNGGMMMYRFLCTHADMLAGGVSVAGTSVAHCLPSASIPLLHVAGTADAVIPYGGGYSQALLTFGSGQVQKVVDSVNALVANDGCSPTPAITGLGTDIVVDRWDGCQHGASHELVTLVGGTHVWPVGGDFDATTEILDFFGITATGPPETTTTTTTITTTTTTTTEDPTTTTTEDPTTTTTEESTTTIP